MKKLQPIFLLAMLLVSSAYAQESDKNNKSIIDNLSQPLAPLAAGDDGQIPLQGRLTDGGSPVNATFEFVFSISYDTVNWSETHPSVQVVNGFYSVALGSITPLPENMFQGVNSRTLDISVGGTALSPIQIYGPYGIKRGTGSNSTEPDSTLRLDNTVTGNYSVASPSNYQMFGPDSTLKLDLNYFPANDAGSVVLYGNNNTRTVILGSTGNTGGETGFLGLYDTNNQNKVDIRVDTLPGGGQDYGRLRLFNSDYSKRIILDGSTSTMQADRLDILNTTSFGQRASLFYNDEFDNANLQFFDANGEIAMDIFTRTFIDTAGVETGKAGEILITNTDPNNGSNTSISTQSFITRGQDGESNAWIGQNWLDGGVQGVNRGMIVLWGDTASRDALNGQDIRRVSLSVADDGFGLDVGKLGLLAPVEGNNQLVELGPVTDDGTLYKGQLTLRGSDGSEFTLTSDGLPPTPATLESDTVVLGNGITEWKTFDTGNGLSAQINFSGGLDGSNNTISGGASLGNKGFDGLNPRNGYLHINDTTAGHAVKIEANSDAGSGDNFGTLEMRNSNGGRIYADSRIMDFYGPTDSLSVRISNTGSSEGTVGFYDSLGVNKGFIRGRNSGGYMQLTQADENSNILSAVLASATNSNSTLNLYGANPTNDGFSLLINNYMTENQIGFGNTDPMQNGLRRSGTDWSANNGEAYLAVGTAGGETGDPNGMSGFITMWGDGSINAQLTGKRWENNNLPIFELIGIRDPNVVMEVMQGPGTENFTDLKLYGTDSTSGYNNENVTITSDLFGQNNGGILLRDSSNFTGIYMDGAGGIDLLNSNNNSGVTITGDGYIAVRTASDNVLSAIEMFQDLDAGLINVNDASNLNAITLEGASGSVFLRDNLGVDRISFSGLSGEYFMFDNNGVQLINNTVTDNGTNNFGQIQLFEANTGNNVNISGEGRLDLNGTNSALTIRDGGSTTRFFFDSSIGNLEMYDGTGGIQVDLDGNSGNIFGNGNLFLNGTTESSGANIYGAFSRMNIWNSTDSTYQVVEAFEEFDYGIIDLRDNTGALSISLQGGSGTIFSGDPLDNAVHINDVSPSIAIFSGGAGGASDNGVQSVSIDGSTGGSISLTDNTGLGRIDIVGQTGEIFADSIFVTDVNYTGALNGPSDRRLKSNITNLSFALDNIRELNGVTFNWNKTAEEEMGIRDKKQQIGVIAQELEAVYPQLVKTNDNGFKTVNYVSLTAVLLEAIKELDVKVTNLENENQELKAELAKSSGSEIDKLKAEIAEIKALISQSQTVGK